MPVFVNGEPVPNELIRLESERLRSMEDWQHAAASLSEFDFRMQLRTAAEHAAIDKILIIQELRTDTRPLDPVAIEREVERAKAQGGCRPGFDETALREQVDATLRYQRTVRDLSGNLPTPPLDQVRAFYRTYRENFRGPETLTAAHIVKNIDETHSEEDARAGIEAALQALERGEPFASVASRLSDCPDNGGDLGAFTRGVMVPEFEEVVFALEHGRRSPIFRTPFGYHIAEVRSRNSEGLAAFEDVREDIERVLTTMQEHEVFKQSMEALRSRSDIRRISREEAARRGLALTP